MDKILTSFDEGKKKVCKMIKLLLPHGLASMRLAS